ncbi:hypothetical protein Tco_1312742 [Tanacetum coccineum]
MALFHCKDPLERGERCKRCSCKWCGSGLSEGFCFICASNNKNSSIGDPNPNSFNDSQNLSDYPPQPQYQTNSENSSNAITPDLPTEEPDNSLSIGDEHLDTISETESDEVIKSSVEDLVPILSNDDDSFENIDYVEASPLDSKLVSLEEVKDDILREKLLNINLLIAKIESLNDNPTPDCVLKSPSPFPISVEDSESFFEKSDTSLSYSDNSLPEFETFSDHMEDQGELTSVVMEDILGEPRVHVPNVLPQPPSYTVIKTLLPFSSDNEDQVFNPGILSSNLLSHLGKITSDFSESPMMIYGGDIPILDDCLDFEDYRARGFVHSSTRSSILSMLIWESDIRDLIDLTFIY